MTPSTVGVDVKIGNAIHTIFHEENAHIEVTKEGYLYVRNVHGEQAIYAVGYWVSVQQHAITEEVQ